MFNLFSLFFRRRKKFFSSRHSSYVIWDHAINRPLALSEYESRIEDLPFGKVIQVLDGDTIVVSIANKISKIRLDAIDCPEDGQKWGDVAKYGLIKLIGGKTVRLETHGLDKYSRTLATIFILNHKHEWMNVNERMVTLGHAWVMRLFYKHLPKDRQQKLNQLERWSKSKNIGLWQDSNPTPPWDWRQKLIYFLFICIKF